MAAQREPNHSHAIDPVVEAFKPGIDRTLLWENLRLTHEERVLKLQQFQRFADELRRAGRELRDEERPS